VHGVVEPAAWTISRAKTTATNAHPPAPDGSPRKNFSFQPA